MYKRIDWKAFLEGAQAVGTVTAVHVNSSRLPLFTWLADSYVA
jgi:hypothetical protein